MVCDRCKTAVKSELNKIGLKVDKIDLGEVELFEDELSSEQLDLVRAHLEQIGFELIGDRKSRIVEQIKIAIIELVHYQNDEDKIKHSEYLAQQLNLDYPLLSKTFSEEEGITIEQYIIQQKIEKVKELLTYDELTLSEIAWKLNYSSVAALSSQFKKVMGFTPTAYKNKKQKERKTLDKVSKP
jgi:AraC-like DNA-binding protein